MALSRGKAEDYLKCGLLEHGFLRIKCDGRRHEHLVAFSCKRRGFCPSCGARRMIESAAHPVDHVFPEAPVRQWVLTFPFPLRFLLAVDPKAFTELLAVVQRAISTFLLHHADLTVSSGARTGAVTLIQRFGSALNLNPHLHMLFLDGAYTFHGSRPTFHHARRPVGEELNRLLDRLSHRIVRVLERRGLLIADPEHPSLDLVPDSSLDHLQAASVAYRIAIGPHAGRKALTLYSVTPLDEAPNHPLLAQQRGRIHLSGVQRDKNMEQMFPAPLWLVVRRQVLAQVRKVEEVVDLAQQVILRHQVIEIEGIKQGFLRLVVVAHHGKELHP